MDNSSILKINELIEKNKNDSLKLLEEIVNIDSFSYDRNGVNRVGKVIKKKLEEWNIPYEVIENKEYGDYIIAKFKGAKQGKILLMGHQDTPHPPGTVAKRPYEKEGNLLRGPGVSDMKSGLVCMLNAALALNKYAYDEICEIELLFTPEEEIGSPVSRKIIEERARGAHSVFNLEAARPNGSVVTARKGSAHLVLEIEGKAAHSGAFIEDGISANDELALKMIEIKQLIDDSKGITVNFGKIEGGVSNNIVSPYASATIHSTFWFEEDFNELYSQINKIVSTPFIEGTKSKLTGEIGMLPMEKNKGTTRLYEIVKNTGEKLGIPIVDEQTKGSSDAGFTSALGVPTICGMGPVGGNWHADDEYMELDSFIPRTKLLADSIYFLAQELK